MAFPTKEHPIALERREQLNPVIQPEPPTHPIVAYLDVGSGRPEPYTHDMLVRRAKRYLRLGEPDPAVHLELWEIREWARTNQLPNDIRAARPASSRKASGPVLEGRVKRSKKKTIEQPTDQLSLFG